MGYERDFKYYDSLFTHSRWNPKNDVSRLPWSPVWQRVAEQIEYLREGMFYPVVADYGCGTGPLIQLLPDDVAYVGIDFSIEALHRAMKRSRHLMRDGDSFLLKDLRRIQAPMDLPHATIHVFCEVLEHLDDDLRILDTVLEMLVNQPRVGNKHLIITVPNFDDPSHVRHFPTSGDVREHFDRAAWPFPYTVEPIGRRVGKVESFPWYLITSST